MAEVYVVTNPELGWDCVVGVFSSDSVSKRKLEEVFPNHVVHSHSVHKDTYEFQEFEE